VIILAILKVNLPEGEKDKFIEDMNNEIKTIEGLEAKDFHYSTSTKRTAKTTTRKDGTKETNYFLESEGLDSEVHRILVEDFAFRAQKEYKEKDYNTELKSIEDIREQFESSSKSSKLTTELKGEYSSAIEQFNSNMDEIIPLEQERYLKVLEGEIDAAKNPKPKKESKIKEELVSGFTDEEVDSKATGKRLYPNSYREIMKILSKIKGSQDIVRYLEESSSSMLDETNPVNQGDKKTPRKMALAKLSMLFDRLEEDSLSALDDEEIKKLKVLLDEPYEGTKIGSLKEYTKKYMKDVGDLNVKPKTLSNLKTLLGRLKNYEEQLVAKNKETDIFRLLGRTKKERRQTLEYLRELHKNPIHARKYDIRGSGDTFEYRKGKKKPKDTSSMSEEKQDEISEIYTRDYFGYETLMEYAESINALLIKRRDSIMTIQQKEELDRLEQETENLAETIEDQVQIGYGVNPQIEEDLETLEQSQEQIADDTSLLDLIRRSTPLMTTIINDSRTKGGMVMLTQEEERKILKNMKNLANIVESYFKQDFDNQRSEEE
tara:strand:- start:6298 stop:7938 length:1641 start_codon:yes stop_codon:yes gene_type:complete